MGLGDRSSDLPDVRSDLSLGLNGIDIDFGAVTLRKAPFGDMHVFDLRPKQRRRFAVWIEGRHGWSRNVNDSHSSISFLRRQTRGN